MQTINRRKLMASGAIGAAAVTLATVPAIASVGEDAELRKLWVEYLAQLERLHEAEAVAAVAREPDDAESSPVMNGEDHERLWRKHKVEGPWRAMTVSPQGRKSF